LGSERTYPEAARAPLRLHVKVGLAWRWRPGHSAAVVAMRPFPVSPHTVLDLEDARVRLSVAFLHRASEQSSLLDKGLEKECRSDSPPANGPSTLAEPRHSPTGKANVSFIVPPAEWKGLT